MIFKGRGLGAKQFMTFSLNIKKTTSFSAHRLKGYLCYQTIISQNVPSKAQIKNFSIS